MLAATTEIPIRVLGPFVTSPHANVRITKEAS